MVQKLSHGDYTVGWVCTLEVEQIAALEMLDEEHCRLPQSHTDHNVYTLGSISGINVVIAGLHQVGNSHAATVVTQLRTTFPNIRWGLLVGIGGGVPVKTDNGLIRLGDVVVSKPHNSHSGTIQYDHGKAQEGVFERTGSLVPPPAVLLNAAQDLAVRRARLRNDPIRDNIKRIDTSLHGLRQFKYPGASQDYLYNSNYKHLQQGLSCAECGCDDLQRINRDQDNEGQPVIHRGTIASGELVIKNAHLRDALAQKYKLLCFETEAAGTLAGFQCLVIRGISDYCDSHKNDLWHGYAAAAAAAYARQLFFHMPIEEIKYPSSNSSLHGIHSIGQQNGYLGDEKILHWLTVLDFGKTQSDYLRLRQPGTCQWLTRSSEFNEWLSGDLPTLVCLGIPGAGKTVMTAIVIDELAHKLGSDNGTAIAYIFCSFRRRNEQRNGALLASLLKQLVRGMMNLPPAVIALYEKHQNTGTRPTVVELVAALQQVTAMYSKVYLIMDALDEYMDPDFHIVEFLSAIFSLQKNSTVPIKVLATSRPLPEIVNEFQTGVKLEIRARDEDIRRCVDGYLLSLPSFVRRSLELQEEIQTAVAKAADGLFLLAQFHIQSLVGKRSVKAVKLALKKLPAGSDAYTKVYKSAMERIEGSVEEKKRLAKESLTWISCAMRPLTTLELQYALAVEAGELIIDKENIPDIMDIISVCAGLVTVDEESSIIRLAHYTTQEFLNENWEQWFHSADAYICRICVNYLCFDTLNQGPCTTMVDLDTRLKQNPLYDYAATYWGHHAYREETENSKEIIKFLNKPKYVESAAQVLLLRNHRFSSEVEKLNSDTIPNSGMTKFHLVAYFDLCNIAKALLSTTTLTQADLINLNSKNILGQTPLTIAVYFKHVCLVRSFIVSCQVDVNACDNGGATPLLHAVHHSYRNNEEIIRLLVESGRADIFALSYGPSPLWLVIHIDNLPAVKLFVNAGGADLDSKDVMVDGGTALEWASRMGSRNTVQELLDSGMVNINRQNTEGRTCLFWSAAEGHDKIVKLLLERGAESDINRKDAEALTPLAKASAAGHVTVVRILLERGAGSEIESRDKFGLTSLSKAAFWGKDAVIKMLLEWGADIESKDNTNRTPLLWAAARGRESALKMLLQAGADITVMECSGLMCLHLASFHGHYAVAKLLLEHSKSQNNVRDADGRMPLFHASWRGHKRTVSLLIEDQTVDKQHMDNYGNNSLLAAILNKHEDITDCILSILKPHASVRQNVTSKLIQDLQNSGIIHLSSHLISRFQINEDHAVSSETPDQNSIAFSQSLDFCNACTMCIPEETLLYICESCQSVDGPFLICQECFHAGMRCRTVCHKMNQERSSSGPLSGAGAGEE